MIVLLLLSTIGEMDTTSFSSCKFGKLERKSVILKATPNLQLPGPCSTRNDGYCSLVETILIVCGKISAQLATNPPNNILFL